MRNQLSGSIMGLIILFIVALVPTAATAAFNLESDVTGPQLLGTTVNASITGSPDDINDTVEYQLTVRQVGGESRTIYHYSTRRDFEWTPLQEGAYVLSAFVRILDDQTGILDTIMFELPVAVLPRATSSPVVQPTQNPLVALYSAPACTPGLSMRVLFVRDTSQHQFATDLKPCDAQGRTMNFYIAGMRADSLYRLRHQLVTAAGNVVGRGPARQFRTGIPATDVELQTFTVVVPPNQNVSSEDALLLTGPTARNGQGAIPAASDLEGELVWYYTKGTTEGEFLLTRILPGGNIYLTGPSPAQDRFTIREIDLAGNTVRESTSRNLSHQLHNLGFQRITNVHHELRLLPTGHTVTLASVERLLEDVQGPGIVDVIGDMIIALDENWQVVWASNLFDHLDVTREAILGESCVSGGPGCPIVAYAPEANDWTHSNAIGYSPADGNLIVSMRHQDWVIKLDFNDGAGTGGLVWRLGKEGDFSISSPETDPWFSHQHDANYMSDNQVIVYDNGNANFDCPNTPQNCRSRGQVFELDETNFIATPVLSADLQNFSFAIGASHVLSNGNYHFDSGLYNGDRIGRADEVDADGNIIYSLEVNKSLYRSFRLRDMYTPPEG